MNILLPVFYLPPISWCSVFFDAENEIKLEKYEHFPKQTYRNRANIYGANGKLSLSIPISHNGKRIVSEIEISHRENWLQLHWKSIKTAYQSSPYFEFYEDQLEKIFNYKTNNLFEFNLNALKIIQQILKAERSYSFSQEYIKNPAEDDFRDFFPTKKTSGFQLEQYYQTFTSKYGFLSDLSIVDLLCNKGPETMTYLKSIKLNTL